MAIFKVNVFSQGNGTLQPCRNGDSNTPPLTMITTSVRSHLAGQECVQNYVRNQCAPLQVCLSLLGDGVNDFCERDPQAELLSRLFRREFLGDMGVVLDMYVAHQNCSCHLWKGKTSMISLLVFF